MPAKSFFIDCISENSTRSFERYAVVAVDVVRSATVAATIIASGRRCFFAPSIDAAIVLATRLENPLLIGEIAGNMPYGFDFNNSPTEIEACKDISRPAIIVSSSGTPLFQLLKRHNSAYVACFRNYGSTARHLISHYDHVAIIGAPTRGEFREEDQMCSAWIAADLVRSGFEPEDQRTIEIYNLWKDLPIKAWANGKSAEYLNSTGQTRDLEFLLGHVNDLDFALAIKGDEIVKVSI